MKPRAFEQNRLENGKNWENTRPNLLLVRTNPRICAQTTDETADFCSLRPLAPRNPLPLFRPACSQIRALARQNQALKNQTRALDFQRQALSPRSRRPYSPHLPILRPRTRLPPRRLKQG